MLYWYMKYMKCPFAAMHMEHVNVLKVQSCFKKKGKT